MEVGRAGCVECVFKLASCLQLRDVMMVACICVFFSPTQCSVPRVGSIPLNNTLAFMEISHVPESLPAPRSLSLQHIVSTSLNLI